MVQPDAMTNGDGPGPVQKAEIGRGIRLRELEKALSFFPAEGRILDLGAGTGLQAATLDASGYSVTALEIGSVTPDPERGILFPVELYDGHTLPYRSSSFDVVFSSYVLEHVSDPVALLRECSRVVAPMGRVVMVLPTFSWRLWSIAAYFIVRARTFVGVRAGRVRKAGRGMRQPEAPSSEPSILIRLIRAMVPPRHGEVGNSLTELVTYTRWWWRRIHRRAGLQIVEEKSLRIFATGQFLSGMSVEQRESVAKVLGGAGRAYVAVRQSTSAFVNDL